MSKEKLLFIGDSPTSQTGFGRVVENILPALLKDYEVTLFGVNYYNEEHDYPYKIYPASGPELERLKTDPFGREELERVFSIVRPDKVVVNNDVWIATDYYKILEPYVQSAQVQFYGYVPIDGGPYHTSLVESMYGWTGVATYTQFGSQVLRNALQSDAVPIEVIPHGTNTTDFYPVERSVARKELGLRDDVFLVFNGNRNQPRKRYDLTVKAFARFAKGKDKNSVGLFAHGGLKNRNGWNVPALLERELKSLGVSTDQHVLFQHNGKNYPQNRVSLETLNLIYNAVDVGINTCTGEGWGLVNTEHACTKTPQIVPDHSSLGELFSEGRGTLIPIHHWDTEMPWLLERGVVSPKTTAHILNAVYEDYTDALKRAEKAYEYFTSPELQWSNVAERVRQWVT